MSLITKYRKKSDASTVNCKLTASDSERARRRDDKRGVGTCQIWCAPLMADSRQCRITAIFITIGASNFSTQDTNHNQEAQPRKAGNQP